MRLVKNKMISLLAGFLICLLYSECNKVRSLSMHEYIAFMDNPDNGFVKRVTSGEYIYEFHFRTPEYVAIKEMGSDLTNKSKIAARIKSLGSSIWLNIHILPEDGGQNSLKRNTKDLEIYNARNNYFLNEAQHHILLMNGDKEENLIIYHFENNYGMTPFDTMVLGYNLSSDIGDIEVIYDDQLFNLGLMKVRLNSSDYKNKPVLIL